MVSRHHHSSLIDQVGPAVIVERFGLSSQSLHNWRTRGIPDLRRMAFAEVAKAAKVPLPTDFLAPLGLKPSNVTRPTASNGTDTYQPEINA